MPLAPSTQKEKPKIRGLSSFPHPSHTDDEKVQLNLPISQANIQQEVAQSPKEGGIIITRPLNDGEGRNTLISTGTILREAVAQSEFKEGGEGGGTRNNGNMDQLTIPLDGGNTLGGNKKHPLASGRSITHLSMDPTNSSELLRVAAANGHSFFRCNVSRPPQAVWLWVRPR